jgi:RNA recognition motif-containing protein
VAQKVFVGSLSFSTTSEGLREFFAKAGTVVSATVVTDQFSGRSRGFGFVEMATAEEAERAISQLGGRTLDGRTITVELAKPRASESRSFAGRGGRGGWR